ncbi:MAG: GspH/FimT family pseudopilin [Pseudomonadota bacterium]
MATTRVTGFSLIELMVAMTVMALLMMAVSPSVTAWIVNLRIRNATDALQNGLQAARNEAVRRNQTMTFWLVSDTSPAALTASCTLSATSGSWVVSVSSPAGACNSAPSTTTAPMLVAAHPLGDGSGSTVTIAAVQSDLSTAASSVAFNGFGRTTSATSIRRINVTSTTSPSNYRSLRIILSDAGSIRVCDPAAPSGDPRTCPSP